jgi:hypothetical protein
MAKKSKSGERKTNGKPASTIQVTFRINTEWLDLADRIALKLSKPGAPLTRTDGFRMAMAAGFEKLKRSHR